MKGYYTSSRLRVQVGCPTAVLGEADRSKHMGGGSAWRRACLERAQGFYVDVAGQCF